MPDSWFKFHRDYFNNQVICRDAEHLAVWCYLKAFAAYQNGQTIFAGSVTVLEPGQLVTGRRAIARATGVTESKVRAILRHFAAAKLIACKSTNSGTFITVLEPHTTAAAKQKRAPQSAGGVCSGDASYDLEAYRRTAIGLLD